MKNPLSNQLERRFQQSYSKQSYIERYTSVYLLFQILQICISAFLAACSFKFWEALFMSKADGLGPTVLAVVATVLVSVIIFLLLNVMLKSYFSGDRIHWLIPTLVALFIAGDIYANVEGIPELTATMIPLPQDSKTPETDAVFGQQLRVVDQELANVKHRYYWCAVHKTNHSSHGVCEHERFWISPKTHQKDYKRIEQLSKQRTDLVAAHNKQRQINLDEHSSEVKDREDTLFKRTSQLKYLQAFMYLLLFIVVYWCHHFGSAAIDDPTYPISSHKATPPTPSAGLPDVNEIIEGIEDLGDFEDEYYEEDPEPGHNGTRRDPYASRRDTPPEPPVRPVTLMGKGFAYSCTHCNKNYLAKRPMMEGQNPFCSQKCRSAFWKVERKRIRQEKKKKEGAGLA